MRSYRRPLWLYPIFQIPLVFLGLFLSAAAIFWLLGLGRPQVAVAIALDLSFSTYENQEFNTPGTVMNQEIKAVQAYLQQNNEDFLRRPNQVKVFGFGGKVKPLTENFDANSQKVNKSLLESLNSEGLAQAIIPNQTDIDLAIQTGSNALTNVAQSCRELILVTDGQGDISPDVVKDAVANKVKINAVVIGQKNQTIEQATRITGGEDLLGNSKNLSTFFSDNLFHRFNSNRKWIIFWLGLAWIALMWMIMLPLDRWVFQGLLKFNMDISGKLTLANSLFWTVATLCAIWGFGGIPFLAGC